MPTNDTRLGLQTPIGSDPPAQLRESIAVNASLLQGSVVLLTGTLANLPAPAINGRIYNATDIGIYYLDTGTAWETMLIAGPWTNLSGFTDFTAAGPPQTPAVRTEGDILRFSGAFGAPTDLEAAFYIVCSLPASVPTGLWWNVSVGPGYDPSFYTPNQVKLSTTGGALELYSPESIPAGWYVPLWGLTATIRDY